MMKDGGGSDAAICYEAELSGNSDYGLLVVSTNGVTGDPQSITDVDSIQGQYVAFLVSSTSRTEKSETSMVCGKGES